MRIAFEVFRDIPLFGRRGLDQGPGRNALATSTGDADLIFSPWFSGGVEGVNIRYVES